MDYFNEVSAGGDIEFQLNFWYNGLLFLVSVLNAVYLQRFGFTVRILWGFIAIGVCMAALPVLDQLRSLSARWAMIFETLVIALAGVLGIADAFAQASLYGLTSAAFPPVMTQALMCGVAICGTLVTLARMACKVLTDDLFVSTYIFFAFSAVYAFGSAALYCTARVRNPLFRSRLKAAIETPPTLALRHYEVRVRPTLPCCVWSWALALPVLTSRGHQGVHSRHALRSFALRGAPQSLPASGSHEPQPTNRRADCASSQLSRPFTHSPSCSTPPLPFPLQTSPKGTVLKPPLSMSFTGQVYDLLVDTPSVREACLMLAIINGQQFLSVPSIVGMTKDFIGEGWSQVFAILVYNVGDVIGRGPLATYFPCPLHFVWPSVAVRFLVNGGICTPLHAMPRTTQRAQSAPSRHHLGYISVLCDRCWRLILPSQAYAWSRTS